MVSTTSPLARRRTNPPADIISNLELLQLAVQQFDVRFILRALRAISSIRKRLTKDGDGLDILKAVRETRTSTSNEKGAATARKLKIEPGALLPEEEVYLAILRQVCISDDTLGTKAGC